MTEQETLIECVRLILDDPSADVRWYQKTNEWVNDGAHVEITVLSMPRVGVDEQRLTPEGSAPGPFTLPRTLPGPSGNLRETIHGNRTLKLQFVCNTSDQDLRDSGPDLADRIIAGFSRTDVAALLDAVNLGVPRSLPVRVIDAPDGHGDMRSIGAFEMWFPWSRTLRGGLVGRIATIVYTGDVDGVTVSDTVTE